MACYEHGRRFFSRSFIVFVLPREGGTFPSRSGAAVGRKIGPAVGRNRVKRLLREFFRLYRDEIAPGADIVVVAKRGLDWKSLCLSVVVDELLPLMRRIRQGLAAPGAGLPA